MDKISKICFKQSINKSKEISNENNGTNNRTI